MARPTVTVLPTRVQRLADRQVAPRDTVGYPCATESAMTGSDDLSDYL
jgi:hypothetical protein